MANNSEPSIRSLDRRDIPACEEILRGLPAWFGIPEAVAHYVDDLRSFPAHVATAGDQILGFIALRHHTPQSSEVHVLAVRHDWHRRGIGRALVEDVAADLRQKGVRLLQVKTLGPSHPDPGYAKTRSFYTALGFVPLEETTAFWGPGQPCLVMVKPLVAGIEGNRQSL